MVFTCDHRANISEPSNGVQLFKALALTSFNIPTGQTEGCSSDAECRLVDPNAVCNTQSKICECGQIMVGFDGRCGTGAKVVCPDSSNGGKVE